MVSTAYDAEVLTDTPVAFWKLDETAGTSCADAVGSFTGTYTGSPTLAQSGLPAGGNAVQFGTSKYVDFGNVLPLAPDTTIAVEAWIKLPTGWGGTGTDVNFAPIITKGDSAWRIGRNGVADSLQWATTSGGTGSATSTAGSPSLADGAWHHVVGVLDGTNKILYIDGVARATVANLTQGTNSNQLRIGGNVNQSARQFPGLITRVALYDHHLTATRVGVHYTAGTTTATVPGVPTSVAATVVSTTELSLSWAAPASGGYVSSYEVRIDAGTPVTATSPHAFTGLSPGSSHTLEVRAVGPGGSSSWVAVTATTTPDSPTSDYQANIRIGGHTWTITADDTADPDVVNVLDGASFTWAAPDNVGWPPPLHTVDRDVCTLRLYSPDAADFGDIRRGDVVRFKFTPTGYTYDDPLVDFAGRVRAVKVTDRGTGGAFLQLTAADHTVTLQDWSVPGETAICTDGDTQAEVLDRISEVLDALEAADTREMVPGAFGNVLNPADASHYTGTVSFDYTIAADEQITAFDLFAVFGFNMMPIPQYDDSTGELDPTQPFVITYLDPYNRDREAVSTDGCVVPAESVQWQRDYTPNVVEDAALGIYWAGETYGATLPDYPDWNLVRVSDPNLDMNLPGLMNEIPDAAWGPFTFTVLGWRDPEAVRGWLRLPSRFTRYVTVTDVDPPWNPNGADTVSGMLRGCTWAIGPNGHWTVDGGLRTSHGNSSPSWADVPGTVTWATVPGTVTWADADTEEFWT